MSQETIWKFEIPYKDEVSIQIPERSSFLHFGSQDGKLMIWMQVDPSKPMEESQFFVRGTGHKVDSRAEHRASTQVEDFVWHLYSRGWY